MLPQLSKAIMSICSALFIESLSTFRHETPDPSKQNPLTRALGSCLYHHFMSSIAATARQIFKWGKSVNISVYPPHLYLYHSSDFHHIPARPSFICTCFSLWRCCWHHSFIVTSLQQTHRAVFVSATDWRLNFGLTITMLILSSDWTLQTRKTEHLLLLRSQKRASFAFSLIQILFTHKII